MLSPEVNRNYAKITRRKKWRTKVRNRNRISFALRNVGSGGVQFRSRHFCTAKNKLIRMQLAFRKVDIDILSINFGKKPKCFNTLKGKPCSTQALEIFQLPANLF